MSKVHLSDFIRKNPNGLATEQFLDATEEYLGLHHGDTTCHPYVPTHHHPYPVIAEVKTVFVAAVQAAQAVKVSSGTSGPALNWHAQYCLGKFGKTTPGF